MFSLCRDLVGNGMEDWDVSNVQSMKWMFSSAWTFNIDISAWNMSNVTDIGGMFNSAIVFNQNINAWDVSSVTNMLRVFFNASIYNQPLDTWDVSSVTHMGGMFAHANIFNQNISSWNTGLVIDMHQMFLDNTNFNQDISGWDVSNVYNMSRMFEDAVFFKKNLGEWDITSVGLMEGMFNNVSLSSSVYDSILIGWASQDVNSNVIFDAPVANYCNGGIARQELVDDHNWIINDAGPGCPPAIAINLKVLLEGAYSPLSGLMNDVLRFNGHIPLTEPFTSLGFNHVGGGGLEQTSQAIMDVVGQDAIVDWVFLEIRDPFNNQILYTQSLLVQRDGDVTDVLGSPPIFILGLDISLLVVAIRHRNHLAVRSLVTIADWDYYFIDFSDPSLSINGIDSRKTIGNKSYLYSGDANGDGSINSVDKNVFWRNQNGQPYSYLNSNADMNLDGAVNSSDLNNNWRPNNGNIEQLD